MSFANPVPISRIDDLYREFTIFFTNSLYFSRIHYLFREFTIFFTIAIYDDSNQGLNLLRYNYVMLT